MEKWTIEKLDDTDDYSFAICILNERANKLHPNAPLAEKIKRTVRTLEKAKAVSAVYTISMTEGNEHEKRQDATAAYGRA